jgi:hypothetical protein
MPRFRADFIVKCSVALPATVPAIALLDNPTIEITLRNAELDEHGHVPEMVAQIVGDCASIDSVADEFREILIAQLDALTFATHSTYFVDQCTRVLDWEPFQKRRRLRPSQKFNPHYPPNPDLQPEFIATAQAIVRAKPDEYVLRALHSFRQGVIAVELREQFLRFWAAIERIAEGTKEVQRVPILCPKCQSDLVCPECNQTPTRRPMATQAIREYLRKINEQGDALFKMLSDTRNHLTHGGSAQTLREKIGMDLGNAVDAAGEAAWYAIWAALPQVDEQLHIGSEGVGFAHRDVTFTADMFFDYPGEAAYPTEDQIPKPIMTMLTSFQPMTPNAPEGS